MASFETVAQAPDCGARLGRLNTAHGTVSTPTFMPVGTRASVKGILPQTLHEVGAEIILANTYHMYLRPGVDTVEKLGGLHAMMAWDGPILTDSGGYQVFSLSTLNRIGEDGVEFASHIDGARIYLDPIVATETQNRLGADIIMCFDECAPWPASREALEACVERTIRWAGQCKNAHANPGQMLFGIVQGGTEHDLREKCAKELMEIGFDGYAIGGLSVGEGHEIMVRTVDFTAPLLDPAKPRYLMGVGMPADIIAAVQAGVDMFDCVLPTRNGRNAYAFTSEGPVRLRNQKYIESCEPIESGCDCYCCRNFSVGTIRHLFNVNEMLGPILVTIHNLRFYQRLMVDIRKKIEDGSFDQWATEQRRADPFGSSMPNGDNKTLNMEGN